MTDKAGMDRSDQRGRAAQRELSDALTQATKAVTSANKALGRLASGVKGDAQQVVKAAEKVVTQLGKDLPEGAYSDMVDRVDQFEASNAAAVQALETAVENGDYGPTPVMALVGFLRNARSAAAQL